MAEMFIMKPTKGGVTVIVTRMVSDPTRKYPRDNDIICVMQDLIDNGHGTISPTNSAINYAKITDIERSFLVIRQESEGQKAFEEHYHEIMRELEGNPPIPRETTQEGE